MTDGDAGGIAHVGRGDRHLRQLDFGLFYSASRHDVINMKDVSWRAPTRGDVYKYSNVGTYICHHTKTVAV